LEASKAKQFNKITYTPSKLTQKFNQFKSWINCTMVVTQLTIKKALKKERTWQEQVLKEYYKYHKVFSEQVVQCFLASKPWDHAIDLLPDASKTLDCKLYPLALGEQDSLDKFIKEHLDKGYIRPSKLPYSFPFFFIKKKDRKL
jgi:hypothetical protein